MNNIKMMILALSLALSFGGCAAKNKSLAGRGSVLADGIGVGIGVKDFNEYPASMMALFGFTDEASAPGTNALRDRVNRDRDNNIAGQLPLTANLATLTAAHSRAFFIFSSQLCTNLVNNDIAKTDKNRRFTNGIASNAKKIDQGLLSNFILNLTQTAVGLRYDSRRCPQPIGSGERRACIDSPGNRSNRIYYELFDLGLGFQNEGERSVGFSDADISAKDRTLPAVCTALLASLIPALR